MVLFKKKQAIDKRELLFSNKDVLKITIPMFLQQVLNFTVGMINTMMVSSAGEAAVSGVSLVNTLDNVLIVFFTALVTGGSVVVAQVLGTKKTKEISNVAKQLIYAATIVAVLLTALVWIFKTPILNMLFGDAEADVMAHAIDYFSIVSLSFPLLAITEAAGACFRSAGNSFISLMTTLFINIFVICGNSIFVIGLGMEAKGTALATLCARFLGAVILLVLIHRKKYPVHVEHILHYRPNFRIVKNILHIGIPNGIENTLFQFGRLLMQSLIAMLGTTVIAANAVALNVVQFQYSVNGAFIACMIPIVGRCIGAKKIDQAKYFSRKLLLLEFIVLAVVSIGILVFIDPLMALYNISSEGVELSKQLIISHVVAAAIIYPLGFLTPSIFQAAADVRFTMVVSMLSMWVLRVAFGYLLALETISVFGLFTISGFGLGIWGVWIAMVSDWLLRAIVYMIRYISGRWLKVKRFIR
jgi:putative MATE family efflux protein